MPRAMALGALRDRAAQGDPVLWLAMFGAMALTLIGADWGRYEDWNPDQMAFRCLTCVEGQPLNPGWFLKPPFFSYLVYGFAQAPAGLLEAALNLDAATGDRLALLLARLLNAALYALTCAVGYATIRPVFGPLPARLFALLFATSAGVAAFAHFLTTETSVTVLMLAAVFFAARILREARLGNYLLAGLMVGVATATKYNALAIGIAIPVAHLLAERPGSLRGLVAAGFDRRLVLGVTAVVPGFVLANPYAVLNFPRFAEDFHYNYVTTPVYGGTAQGTSYLDFFAAFAEIFGLPLCAAIGVGVLLLARAWLGGRLGGRLGCRLGRDQANLVLLLLGTFLLYYAKFGSFPRFETRFALPVAPLVLMLGVLPFGLVRSPRAVLAAALPIAAYGVLCGVLVGLQFRADPRMAAQEWVRALPAGVTIEATSYTPAFRKVPGLEASFARAPVISGRSRLLGEVAEDLGVTEELARNEGEERVDWYAEAALLARQPDYVASNSLYYDRFYAPPMDRLYPEMAAFYDGLLGEQYCYRTVFDRRSPDAPAWVYPRKIDFLRNRMVIQKLDEACLQRKTAPKADTKG